MGSKFSTSTRTTARSRWLGPHHSSLELEPLVQEDRDVNGALHEAVVGDDSARGIGDYARPLTLRLVAEGALLQGLDPDVPDRRQGVLH
jgi:hypothetical protein